MKKHIICFDLVHGDVSRHTYAAQQCECLQRETEHAETEGPSVVRADQGAMQKAWFYRRAPIGVAPLDGTKIIGTTANERDEVSVRETIETAESSSSVVDSAFA